MKTGRYYANLLKQYNNCGPALTNDEANDLHSFLMELGEFFVANGDKIIASGIYGSAHSINNMLQARKLL